MLFNLGSVEAVPAVGPTRSLLGTFRPFNRFGTRNFPAESNIMPKLLNGHHFSADKFVSLSHINRKPSGSGHHPTQKASPSTAAGSSESSLNLRLMGNVPRRQI